MKLIGRTIKRGLSNPVMPDFDFNPQKYDGPSKEEVIDKRNKYVNPAVYTLYQEPVMLVEGNMQYLYDENGRRYLDMLAGVVSVGVGHSHPKIVEACKEQFEKLQHTTTIYLNPNISDYAEALCSKLPDHLDTVFFTNSGSESTDLAILLSRLHTQNYEIIGLRQSYHGGSNGAMGLTSLHTWKFPVPHGFGIQKAICPNLYRGVWCDLPEKEQAKKYANDVLEIIDYCTDGSVAGFMCEPIQGVAGVVEYPRPYLSEVYDIVRSRGGVCIADEVQTGFGRLGTHYWGFEESGVVPDIVTMAKGIANGIPCGAVVTTKEIGAHLSSKLFFNTFGGNPVSMKLAKTVIDIIDEEKLQQNSVERGTQLMNGLKKLQEKYEVIGDVRGKGLMVGLELVKDRATKTPATEETTAIQEMAKDDYAVLLGKGGMSGNSFRMTPPMCISEEDIDFVLDVFDECFSKI